MPRTLDVYLRRDLTGHLIQDDGGQIAYEYAQSWLANTAAMPLSHSLPLREERFKRKECEGFFGGILPEQHVRELVAKNLGISVKNDFAMLEGIGGECAGAVTFMPAGQPLPEGVDRYREMSDPELAEMLNTLPRRPLLAGEKDVRLSLAGAQYKVAVKLEGSKIFVALNGAPTTHILKPAHQQFTGLVYNEHLCLRLARAVGLSAASAEMRSIQGMDYLLVERYDRKRVESPGAEMRYERLHQEDFCQALGVVSEKKYQTEGGPSLKDCFGLLRETSTTPVIDLQKLLDGVIFNYLIGNNDAHAKNFSLIYPSKDEAWLAPLYDVVCTIYYRELSENMAMRIGGEYVLQKIGPFQFEKMAEESGLARPLVKRRVVELATDVAESLKAIEPRQPAEREITKIVRLRGEEIAARFSK